MFSSGKCTLLQSGYFNKTLRSFQSTNSTITSNNLMYPLFLTEDPNAVEPIQGMPNVCRYGKNKIVSVLEPLVKKGLSSVLLFGVITNLKKDEKGINADSPQNPVIQAIGEIKTTFPELLIACDVCLCAYTIHGHCGILDSDGTINFIKSTERLSDVAVIYAKAGAHVVAPSCMMDGVVSAITSKLSHLGLQNKVCILSYSVKFSSCFYGPFRNAAKSAPSFGDRKAHQLPIGSAGLAKRAAARDVEEGANMLMVKPGLPYLDIIKQTKDSFPELPLFVYQVSGEYSMFLSAAEAGVLDLKTAVMEVLASFRRAGADCIITYFVPLILDWMESSSQKCLILSS